MAKLNGTGDFINLTNFQKKVLKATQDIPKGKVTTYGNLAKYIGCGSPRAVGSALKKNPCVKTYFCHRVIPSNFRIGGYFGAIDGKNVETKKDRLEKEGVKFEKKGKNFVLTDKTRVHTF